jgi:phosphate/phosphite/phosphonate ABC transporter binding protein
VDRNDLVFALTWQRNTEPIGPRMAALTRWLGARLECNVIPRCALSYEELVPMFDSGHVDIAWLPPIVHWHLDRAKLARSLLVNERDGHARYSCVLIGRKGSEHASLERLQGARAAWVDPWSASGYVLAQVALAERGIDPRKTFLEERFFGSRDAALRAVADGRFDVTATFAYFEGERMVRCGWDEIPDAASTFEVLSRAGDIPSDCIATARSMSDETRERVAGAFEAALADPAASELLRSTFNVEHFRRGEPKDEDLSASLTRARETGLLPHL